MVLTSKCPSLSLATLWRCRYAVLQSPSRLLVRQTERERERREEEKGRRRGRRDEEKLQVRQEHDKERLEY